MKKSSWEREKYFFGEGFEAVIGVDEVGRGPLAGPVVAGVAMIKNFSALDFSDNRWDLVRDSKTLSPKQREKTLAFIYDNFYIGIGWCDNKTIDDINILEASFLAMKKALSDIYVKINQAMKNNLQNGKYRVQNSKHIILVDGNKKIPNLSVFQEAVIGGDGSVKSISAASIAAKVIRDQMMLEAHKKHPQYGFDKHKGYGTRAHMEALQQLGSCEIHRQSFEPMPTLAKKK